MTASEAKQIAIDKDVEKTYQLKLYSDISFDIEWAAKEGNYQVRIDFVAKYEKLDYYSFIKNRDSVAKELTDYVLEKLNEDGYEVSNVVDDIYLISWKNAEIESEEDPDSQDSELDIDVGM